MREYFGAAWAIFLKDAREEWRSREGLAAMVIFALLVLTLFSFAFGPGEEGAGSPALSPGVLWLAILFAAVLGLNRSLAAERESEGLQAMRLAPIERSAIFLGKMLSNLFFLLLLELVAFPIFGALYRAPLAEVAFPLALVTLAGTVGVSAAGTLIATMASASRAREVLLPVLLFPILVPVLIAAVKATGGLLRGQGLGAVSDWLRLLVVFDVVFVIASLLVFEYLIEE
ncbi:MAG: heme exporter protein CcmB [Nitrospinota bacterium]